MKGKTQESVIINNGLSSAKLKKHYFIPNKFKTKDQISSDFCPLKRFVFFFFLVSGRKNGLFQKL